MRSCLFLLLEMVMWVAVVAGVAAMFLGHQGNWSFGGIFWLVLTSLGLVVGAFVVSIILAAIASDD